MILSHCVFILMLPFPRVPPLKHALGLSVLFHFSNLSLKINFLIRLFLSPIEQRALSLYPVQAYISTDVIYYCSLKKQRTNNNKNMSRSSSPIASHIEIYGLTPEICGCIFKILFSLKN